MKKFTFLKSLFSPFKPFSLKFYLGKVNVGTPYFFPRKWVKTEKGHKPYPKKIGFDFVDLGWKTKWNSTDYRFEYAPLISFVFFKFQFVIFFVVPEVDHYWEAWLYYERNTDKTKSQYERIQQCRREFPMNWIKSKDGIDVKIDYYEKVLRKKFLK